MDMKSCGRKKCSQINPQPFENFAKGKTKDGLSSYCKKCMKEYSDAWYLKNWERKNVSARKWQAENPEKYRSICKEWAKANSNKRVESASRYRKKNPEKERIWQAQKKRRNKGTVNALCAKRRAAKLQRTPPWLTEVHFAQIKIFYNAAVSLTKELGVKMVVDHIVPLQGENISGLHVPWNLQVISELENSRKNNRF